MADAVALPPARRASPTDRGRDAGERAFVALLGQDFGDRIRSGRRARPLGLDWGNFRKGYLK